MTTQTSLSRRTSQGGLSLPTGRPMYEVRDEFGNRVCHCGTQADADRKVLDNPGFTWDLFYWPATPPNPVVNIDAYRLENEKALPESDWEELP